MNFELQAIAQLSEELSQKVDRLRKEASPIAGRARTLEEELTHADKYCSDNDIRRWVLAFENGDCIGAIAVFYRLVDFRHQTVKLGGIGKVRVREDKRRQGIASAMMVEAMSVLHELTCDVAYLCTDQNSFLSAFYEKYGFRAMNHPYTYRSKSGKVYTENDGMLAPIQSPKIYQDIMSTQAPFDIGIGNW